jgi:hypothetical protein
VAGDSNSDFDLGRSKLFIRREPNVAINTGKVIVGGLVAGLVFNVLDILWQMLVMQPEFDANLTRLNLDPAAMQTMSAMAPWIVIDFIYGILAVWVYAGMRPRFGPGPKTAALAAIAIWAAIALIMYGLTSMGIFTMSIWVKMTLYSLVASIIGTTAGAAVYKEA